MICFKCLKPLKGPPTYGLHSHCFKESFQLPQILEFENIDPRGQLEKNRDSFFHGRYCKYSAQLGKQEYILKVQEDDFPELPASEFLCNQIATLLALKVPDYLLIRFEDKMTFITKNFMQKEQGTLQHIFHFLPPGDENYNCQEIMTALLRETKHLANVIKFIEICLFDALIGNNDRHGRNLGLIITPKGTLLAPMYDNPSYLSIEQDSLLGAHINPSGKIWTSNSKEPKIQDYIDEFTASGHQKAVDRFKKRVLEKSDQIMAIIEKAFISEKRKKAFTRLIQSKIEVLNG